MILQPWFMIIMIFCKSSTKIYSSFCLLAAMSWCLLLCGNKQTAGMIYDCTVWYVVRDLKMVAFHGSVIVLSLRPWIRGVPCMQPSKEHVLWGTQQWGTARRAPKLASPSLFRWWKMKVGFHPNCRPGKDGGSWSFKPRDHWAMLNPHLNPSTMFNIA